MKLDSIRFGLAAGIVWGLGMVFLALLARLLDWGGPAVSLLSSVYLGFAATWAGLFIGAIWGFADGFIGGFLIAWLYNRLLPAAE